MTVTTNPWIWEYGSPDGITVYNTTEFDTLNDLKKAVAASFSDYTWEEVERRGIRGTSILVGNGRGGYEDLGNWAYRRPEVLPPWFPGKPGSQWRDVDGDIWTHREDGYVYMDRRPNERASHEIVHRKYGPMMLVGGEG